ncbi:MAG: hypothetical protein A3B68_08200 [Candidatus Melainabacteria bacterium RIFCSPHIGHO2_02_FULL_34_12]|nr:MAG: hypothetical protein A3B68_08200 [Candidatus Melainabacteria bacterium RIFCSPHIGHO2_02_FULL_34_12]
MSAPIIISAITFMAVIFICITIFFIIQGKQDTKEQTTRVEQAVSIKTLGYSEIPHEEDKAKSEDAGSLRRDTRISSIPWLNNILLRISKGNVKSLMILIEQGGLKIKAGEFLLLSVLIGFIGALSVDLFFHIPFAGFICVLLPFLMLNILKGKRMEAFVKQMPQALDLLSSDLRAGLDIQAGMKHLSEEFSAPIGEEFAKVVVEINLGLTLNESLNNLSKRMNTIDVQILCTGIIINRELGGNLSELIGNVSETIRERFKLKGMVKALTAENQMSSYLLIGLPIGLYILLNVLSPTIYGPFIQDPIGKMIITGCVISMIIGYLIIQKITKLEV